MVRKKCSYQQTISMRSRLQTTGWSNGYRPKMRILIRSSRQGICRRPSLPCEQQRAQQTLAAQELVRTQMLLKQGYATRELFDQRTQAMNAANAGLNAATERVAQTERALEASKHDVGLYTVNINDNDLVAPRD